MSVNKIQRGEFFDFSLIVSQVKGCGLALHLGLSVRLEIWFKKD
ncbi:MAG: hypothetical protein NZO16_05745 [Deltaproteobacteria bacterium]|nr:hypothetical protein [Deltaproteobacteria bacterium]